MRILSRPKQHLIERIKKIYELVKPEEAKAVMRNFASLSVVQSVTYILPVIITPYLFRVIGPGKFGLLAFAQALMQYFMILTDYGFNISATREISLCRDNKCDVSRVFSEVMMVKFALAIVGLLLLLGMVTYIPKFKNDWLVYILSFGMVVGNTLIPIWLFQGIEKMKHIAFLNLVGGLFMLISIFVVVRRPQDFIWVPVVTSCAFLITGLWAQRIAFSRFGISFKLPGYAGFRSQFSSGWDIFISNVAINAYTATRIFVVGLLTDNTITGFYAVAERIANAVQTFPLLSFSQAVFPRLSKIFNENKALAFELMRYIQQITVAISSTVIAVMFLFAPAIVKVFLGGAYSSTVVSLRLLLLAVFFVTANAFRVQFLLVSGETSTYSRIHVFVSLIGLPLIILLVVSFGFTGAAIASIFIEAAIFFATYFSIRRLRFA